MNIEIGSFQDIYDKTMKLDKHPFPLPSVYKLRTDPCVAQKFKSQKDEKK